VLDDRPACLRIEVLAPEEGTQSAGLAASGTRPVFDWTLNPA
jgi:hypothetical protein